MVESWDPPSYDLIDVANVTPRTAPPYGTINTVQAGTRYVLEAHDRSGKLLIGPLGVNYYRDGEPDRDLTFLRRWDVPPYRSRSHSRHDPEDSEG